MRTPRPRPGRPSTPLRRAPISLWVALVAALRAAGKSCPPEVAESVAALGLKAIQAGDPLFWCGVHASRMGKTRPVGTSAGKLYRW